ncbi:unnamed protein product [Sphagnum balticum]
MQTAVHQLWPPPGDMRKTEMNILFFHSYPRDPDDWKSAWTQRSHPDVCWPEKWLPADLGFDVRVLFASFSAYSIFCYVVDDLFKALVMSCASVTTDEWDLCKNHQPLVLVGRGFGTRVLDNLFLKATEEVLTSPTEAGAFVRNVRGVTLYRYRDKSYKIEKFFGGRSEDIFHLYTRGDLSSRRAVFVTQGSMLINPAIYGKNLTRDVVGLDPCQWIREAISEDWDPEVRWKPESKQSRGYILLLESCRMVVHAKSVNDPSTGILGFNLWDYFSRLQITRGLGSATRDTSGEGGSHVGGTGTPSEGDKDQGGDGREDDDNRKGQGAKGKEIQQNEQWDVLVTVHTGTRDLKDTLLEQTQATSSQATFGVTGGFHGFASASASFTKPLASTLQSNQRVTEIPSEFISGTGFHPECHDLGGPIPILRYDFNFRPELPTNMFPDGSDQEKYHGMRCTVYPRFEGVWGLLSQDEACKYEFRVERHTYKVTLYINHKMSNIGTLQEFGTDTLSKGNPKNALMELSVDPSGRGSDEASSSTQ